MVELGHRDIEDREEERIFEPELEEQLWAYPDKWVVTTRSELIAIGETPREAIETARATGRDISRAILHHVLRPGSYFF